MTHSRLTRFVTGWISVFEWMIQWLTQDWLVSLLDESVFLNESLEWMIQWLTPDWLDSLLDESVFLNEWFNDSLKIDSFRYWMNQCFWMNLLNEWFIDSLKIDSSRYWMNQCFERMTHSRLTRFITGWISVLNEWFNDSLKIDSFRYWMNQCFERLTRLVTEWISVLNEWLTQDWLVSLLDESVFLNESLEWMIQWLTQDWLVSLLDESVFLNDSKTNTYLTAHFLHLKMKDVHTGIDEWNLNVILQQVSDSGIDLWSPTLHITHSQRRRGGTDGSFSLWLSLSYLTGASHTSAYSCAVITDPRRLRRPDASLSVLCNYSNRVSAALTKVKKTLGTNRTGHNTSICSLNVNP